MIQHHTGTFSKGIHHSFHSLLSSSSLHFSHIFSRMVPAGCPAYKLWHAKTLANGGGHPLISVCACLKASYHILLCCNIFYVDPNITEKEALTHFGIPPHCDNAGNRLFFIFVIMPTFGKMAPHVRLNDHLFSVNPPLEYG